MATLEGGLKTLVVGEQAWHSKINQNMQRIDNTFNNDSSSTRMAFDFSEITVSEFTSGSHANAVAKFVGETVKVKASSAIALGDVCSIYNDSGVIKAIPTPAGDSDDKIWGVAVEAISSGSSGLVLTYGICPAKIKNGTTTTYNFCDRIGIGTGTSAGAMKPVTSSPDIVAWSMENGVSLDTSSSEKFLCVFVMRQGEHY